MRIDKLTADEARGNEYRRKSWNGLSKYCVVVMFTCGTFKFPDGGKLAPKVLTADDWYVSKAAPESDLSEKSYMIFVVGGSNPKKIHENLELATTEARRLASLPTNLHRKVMVLQEVCTYVSDITIKKS